MNLIEYVFYYTIVVSNYRPVILATREPKVESRVVLGAELKTYLKKTVA